MYVCSECGGIGYDKPLGAPKRVRSKKICSLKYCPSGGERMNGCKHSDLVDEDGKELAEC
jgi:hypothetical protein